jgi:hypothetical protein
VAAAAGPSSLSSSQARNADLLDGVQAAGPGVQPHTGSRRAGPDRRNGRRLGRGRAAEFVPADDPPVDCFYVYPTISRDETPYSDWEASPEEAGYVVLHQAARIASTCRVFAPIYRQRTLTALLASLGGSDPPGGQGGDPFAGVLDAFRTCMAEDNDGRGFVLVGHSQGAGLSAS